MSTRGGLISVVHPNSLAARLGLQPGDELLAINGHPVRDAIDVQFYGAQERLTLSVRREGQEQTLRARRRYDEPLGLEFTRPTFDTDIRRCNNRCDFCFVSQMPPGLRPSLYIKDDDYRHSFLFGNYITLTNLTEEDWARIAEQHLSPLYVSVQATDPDLRRRMLGNPRAPDVMEQLRRLADMGIEVHTQLVLVPGLNDGHQLDRSIGDLEGLYPAVRSVSVVRWG
jgi:putative radical SAM enzyme (TIGR03279 family)